jgi:hypothetical protein
MTTQKGKLIFSKGAWKVYQQDAGMGERDYCILHNDVFFARTDMHSSVTLIVNAVDRYLGIKGLS